MVRKFTPRIDPFVLYISYTEYRCSCISWLQIVMIFLFRVKVFGYSSWYIIRKRMITNGLNKPTAPRTPFSKLLCAYSSSLSFTYTWILHITSLCIYIYNYTWCSDCTSNNINCWLQNKSYTLRRMMSPLVDIASIVCSIYAFISHGRYHYNSQVMENNQISGWCSSNFGCVMTREAIPNDWGILITFCYSAMGHCQSKTDRIIGNVNRIWKFLNPQVRKPTKFRNRRNFFMIIIKDSKVCFCSILGNCSYIWYPFDAMSETSLLCT